MSGSIPDVLPPAALAQVLEVIDLGIIGYRAHDDRVLFCNRKARDLLALELDSGTIKSLFGLSPHNLRHSSSRLLVGDSVRVGERHVGFTVYDLPDETQWIVLRDVTDKLHLQRAAEGVTVTNNLGYAFAGVAHELGNPINSVKTAATVLRSNLDVFSREQVREYLSLMLDETVRMQEILRLMQSFAGRSTLVRERTDLAALCDSIVALARRETIPPSVTLRVLSEGRSGVWTHVDPSAFRQVLLNLLSNAVEAVSESAEPTVTVNAYRGDTFAHLRVSDNGRGLTKEQQERLFFPFYSTREKGMGFGLVIVRKLVSGMDGTIEVFSAPNVGTVFDLRFALDDEHTDSGTSP